MSGLRHNFDPHLYFQPDYHDGTAVCKFALRLDPDSVFNHEWRDAASPYRVGPSIWIENGTLRAANRNLTTIPTGAWVQIEVRADLGKNANGTWSLTIRQPGKAEVVEATLPCDRTWKSLEWLGFSSQAIRPTAFYLDDLEVHNVP